MVNVLSGVPCWQVSHVSTECDYPLGQEAKASIQDEWAVSQVMRVEASKL